LLVISGGEEADRADNDAAAGSFFVAAVLIGDDADGFVFVAFFFGVASAAAGVVVCGGAVRFEEDHDGCQMDGGVAAAREDEEAAALARRDDDDEEVELLDVAAVDQEGWNIDDDIEDTARPVGRLRTVMVAQFELVPDRFDFNFRRSWESMGKASSGGDTSASVIIIMPALVSSYTWGFLKG